MEIPLSGKWRVILLALTLGFGAVASLEAGRLWLADTLGRSSAPADWERAAKLEPGNAAHWSRLGRFRQWDFEHTDLPRAVESYRRAAEANPTSPFRWMDLAGAYEMVGDVTHARAAYQRARALYPAATEVAWNYGNFLLRAGRSEEAFAEIRRAVTGNLSLVPLAVSVCWKSGAGVDRILHDVLPEHAATLLAATQFFLEERRLDEALQVWGGMKGLREPLELNRAFPLIEALLQASRVDDAMRVWSEALAAVPNAAGGRRGDSLVWDGGFEQDFLNGGFGWRAEPVPSGVRLDFESGAGASGRRALRVTFDGSTNVNLGHPYQFIAVEPGRRYLLSARVRLEGITTDSGVRLRVWDARQPQALDVSTPSLTGTAPWSEQQVEFLTGAATRLVLLALVRGPSAKFDNKIRGTVWLDDVSLAPAASHSPP